MRFRKNCFTIVTLTLIAITSVLFIAQIAANPDDTIEHESAFRLGQGLGAGVIMCISLPLIILFALLAWRNAAGIATEKRHNEQVAAIKSMRE